MGRTMNKGGLHRLLSIPLVMVSGQHRLQQPAREAVILCANCGVVVQEVECVQCVSACWHDQVDCQRRHAECIVCVCVGVRVCVPGEGISAGKAGLGLVRWLSCDEFSEPNPSNSLRPPSLHEAWKGMKGDYAMHTRHGGCVLAAVAVLPCPCSLRPFKLLAAAYSRDSIRWRFCWQVSQKRKGGCLSKKPKP